MQYDYNYRAQGAAAFNAGLPRKAPTRLELPATYVLFQVQDARNLWARGYDEAQAAANAVKPANAVLSRAAGNPDLPTP